MNASEARDLSVDQLKDKLSQLKREQFNLRFQRATGQLEKTDRVRECRREIARVKTILREKDVAANA
ncbi:MAG: 50S ribosomal protein L29 [Alphaproteobacteria bacterium]|nr:50S ribosomal protein L29 [Alphaproteobacteria bacterium]